ncbi:XRE family transcriptional regulator [Streptomyces sp. NPDC048434]|uniref:XRE family transcriptional regulator n=1 Tax=Streptomyces sp. NPDC048434 TaxID=3365549 RepID=UPI00371B70E3
MGGPNTILQTVRKGLLMSQDDLARALRAAGDRSGDPNDASKRLVQRWESGSISVPRPVYARALETVTGLPIDSLGFSGLASVARVTDDGAGGHDLQPAPSGVAPAQAHPPRSEASPSRGPHSGVWLSRYEYFSSGRDATHTGRHFVVVLQHGHRLAVRSLPDSSDSPLTMDLEIDGAVVTGSWTEQTASEGYYAGARYHGAIQMLVEPTGRRIAGKWVGFGKDFDVNTGPWELVFQDASTSKATLAKYNHRP